MEIRGSSASMSAFARNVGAGATLSDSEHSTESRVAHSVLSLATPAAALPPLRVPPEAPWRVFSASAGGGHRQCERDLRHRRFAITRRVLVSSAAFSSLHRGTMRRCPCFAQKSKKGAAQCWKLFPVRAVRVTPPSPPRSNRSAGSRATASISVSPAEATRGRSGTTPSNSNSRSDRSFTLTPEGDGSPRVRSRSGSGAGTETATKF
jgi:hypothetical protein